MTTLSTTSTNPAPDFTAIKARQQATWGTGDYSVVGNTLQIVGETLCEAADVRASSRVLDVATGSGNAALAAARRFARVVGVDYVPALLDHARSRALADRLDIDFRDGDCEALPFRDAEFDVVLSTFGVMFAPDHARSAHELARVCKPGGRIGLANWTPEGFIGRLFAIVGRHVAPPAGVTSPLAWGTEAHVRALFGSRASGVSVRRAQFVFRYRSPEHCLDVFRTYYGPVNRAFATLPPAQQAEFEREILALFRENNRSGDASLAASSEYLEIVVTRA